MLESSRQKKVLIHLPHRYNAKLAQDADGHQPSNAQTPLLPAGLFAERSQAFVTLRSTWELLHTPSMSMVCGSENVKNIPLNNLLT